MNIDTPMFLRLVENAGTLAFLDIEGTGLKGDYNSILVVSLKPYGKKPYSVVVDKPGDDRALVRAAKRELEKYDCWVGYYSKGYDKKMINTRLLNAGSKPLEDRHHIDLYFGLKEKLLMARRSQAHMLRFLETLEQKMDMNPDEWNKVLAAPATWLPRMVKRCESDVTGLEALYEKTKHLLKAVTR